MENWEDGWDRLLEEANRQLQKEMQRIQNAWKGIYSGMDSRVNDMPRGNNISHGSGVFQDDQDPGGGSSQPGFTSCVYGEEPIRRASVSGRMGAGNTTGQSETGKPGNNYSENRSKKKASNRKLPNQLEQLLKKIRQDSPYPFIDYRLERNPLYQLNFYDESYHFYEQAVFMADYEDNCPYEGEIGQIFWPTYQKLDTAQLRGYFTWRTKVRRVYEACRAMIKTPSLNKAVDLSAEAETTLEGNAELEAGTRKTTGQTIVMQENREIPKTRVIAEAPLCYQYLYVYEILNQVGVDSAWDGYQRLKYLEANLDGKKSGILPHLQEWLFDYVIYYQLDRSLLADTKRVVNDHALSVLLGMEEHTPEEVFDAATVLSAYHVESSRYVRENTKQYQDVLYHVLAQMVSYYEKNRKNGFWESLFGVSCIHSYEMFEGAIFYERHANQEDSSQEIHYALDELTWFDYVRGRWKCDGYYSIDKDLTLGKIMCAVDAELRTQYQYEFPVRNTLDIKYLNAIVVREVRRCWKEEEKQKKEAELAVKAEERRKKQEELQQKKQEAERLRLEEERLRAEEERRKREVVLDFGKLDEIRRAAEITQQRLLVEEPDAETMTSEHPENDLQNTAFVESAQKTGTLQETEVTAYAENSGSIDNTENVENAEKAENAGNIISVQNAEITGNTEKAESGILLRGITFTEAEVYILRALLNGEDYKAYFQSHRLMSSIVVEALNEKLYDEIGDIVIEFNGEDPVLVEDYIDDIRELFAEFV